MTLLDFLNSPKFDFMQNRCGGKIIKYQQSQAITSHFESFWSIVGIKNYKVKMYDDTNMNLLQMRVI